MGALCFCGWAFYQIGSTVRENRAALALTLSSAKVGIPDVFAESRDVTIALLKPCKPGKPASCGLIPAIRSVAVDAGAATVAMQSQIRQTEPVIQSAALALQNTSDHANTAIDAMTAAGLQARVALGTLNTSIAASQPLLEAYTQSGRDLNAILERPAIPALLNSSASLMSNAAGISADGKKITDKLTGDYLSPQPWWKKLARYASDTYDYGALFARHTP